MTDRSGFPDIRIGHTTRGIGDEGVWPSFTDIMAVIVMIFLMALAVIMVQKLDLSRELAITQSNQEQAEQARDTLQTQLEEMRLERSVQQEELRLQKRQLDSLKSEVGGLQALRDNLSTTAEKLSEEKKEIEVRVENLLNIERQLLKDKQQSQKRIEEFMEAEQLSQQKVEMLILENQALLSQMTGLEQQLSDLELASVESIRSLTEQRSSLEQKLDAVTSQLVSVQQLLDQSTLTNQELQEEIDRNLTAQELQAEEYRMTAEQIETLEKLLRLMELQIVDLEDQASLSDKRYQSLKQEYDSLEEKYRDLVRPARSEAGKQVVSVYFDKIDSEFVYRIREPGQQDSRPVGETELHEALQILQDEFDLELYVKVVIPENSILTHNEAWAFTRAVHDRYDYYYQQQDTP